jgi:hypothetical protein
MLKKRNLLIQIKCLKKINEMKKIIVLSLCQNYDVGGLVRYFIKMFENNELFGNHFEVITSKKIREEYGLFEVDGWEAQSIEKDFIKKIKEDDIDQYIILGIHPYGLHTAIESETKIKKIAWTNDPHYFSNYAERNGETVQDFSESFDPEILEKIDYLITPSKIWFKNLKIEKYEQKIKYFFYFLNEELFSKTGNKNYEQRISKIVLSGCVGGGYLSRIEFDKLRTTKNFKDLIYKIEHPGYENNEHMTDINYYDELTKYRAAFVGHYKPPINFLLAKHIEVLMCGCLGFFEPNPLLETELGLIAFEHYIPCFDENNQLIKDENFYKNWMESKEGEEIAENGKSYVREKFGKKYIQELIEFLKTI